MLTRSCFSVRVFTKPEEPLLNTTVSYLLPVQRAWCCLWKMTFVVGHPGRQAEPL